MNMKKGLTIFFLDNDLSTNVSSYEMKYLGRDAF